MYHVQYLDGDGDDDDITNTPGGINFVLLLILMVGFDTEDYVNADPTEKVDTIYE